MYSNADNVMAKKKKKNYSVRKILNSIFTSGFRLLDPTLPN